MLLEREHELERLDAAVRDARAGRGALLVVEGAAGIGKTRLLEALRARARRQDMVVAAARASELDREFPFGVVRQLFEPLVLRADDERRGRLLGGPAALVAGLLGVGSPESDAGDSLAHFHALYWLIANLAEEAPVALVVDDVHWADASSLRFFEFLAPRLAELPALVALALRPHESAGREGVGALVVDALARVVRPAPLSVPAVAELVAAELGEAPEPGFAQSCQEATGGNPFLVRELVAELARDHVRPRDDRASMVRQLAPQTVGRAVLLRLARLGPEATALARAVAVLDEAPLPRAAALAGLAQEQAAGLAAALAESGILAPSLPLTYAHPILRAVVYADVDATARAAAHRRAAGLLAEEGAGEDAIAVHLLATEPAADASVASTLRRAAASAGERGAGSVAVACLRRALAEPPLAAERAEVLLELASAEVRAGDAASAVGHFDEAAQHLTDPRSRAAAAVEHALALQALGRAHDARVVRERAAEEVAPVDSELALLLEAILIASATLDLSRLDWARERLERHRTRLAGAAAGEQRLLAIQAYLDAFYGDQPAESPADAAERALGFGELMRTGIGVSTTAFFFAVEVLWLADRAEPAQRALDGAIEVARRRGSAPLFACASGWRCLLRARQGALAEAEADARSCAELALSQGWFAMGPPMLGYVLEVLIDRGELDEAERILRGTGLADRAADHDLTFHPMFHARARLRGARGDLAGARDDVGRLRARRARWNTDLTLVPAALAVPQLGGAAESADVERMLSDARGWGTPRAVGMALHAAGLADGGPRGLELLHDAATLLEDSPARLEYARAATDLGAALRRANRRVDAREPLRRALDVANTCGAPPLAARITYELRAAGGRPRRERLTGAGSLTASERRVAEMAADGLSNPEIAQALFVSKKTVETHLGSVFRKLDITSRTRLPAALRTDDG